jgi:hexosaminidase
MVDPTKETTYEFFEAFFTEISKIFPDSYLHLGSDEVDYHCWESDSNIFNWMANHSISSYSELQNYFEQRIQKLGSQLGKKIILWEESFDSHFDLLESTVSQVWLNKEKVDEIVRAGKQ